MSMTTQPDILACTPLIHTLISRMMPGLDATDRDDLQQDIFVHLLEVSPQHDPAKSKFTTWAWRIIHNKIVDFARQRRQTLADIDAIDPPAPRAEPPGAELPEPDISTLTDKQRAMWERLRQGQKPAAIARELGVSREACARMKSRLITRLKTVTLAA